jgi:hypothetical protein
MPLVQTQSAGTGIFLIYFFTHPPHRKTYETKADGRMDGHDFPIMRSFYALIKERIMNIQDNTNLQVPYKSVAMSKNENTRVYPKVSGLAVWSENCKWYNSLPLGAVVSLFCESV